MASELPVPGREPSQCVAGAPEGSRGTSEDQRTVVGEGAPPADHEEPLVIESSEQPEIAEQHRVVLAVDDLLQGFHETHDAGGTNVDHEHAVLDPVAVGLQLLGHPETPRVIDYVVGDEIATAGVPAHRVRIPI